MNSAQTPKTMSEWEHERNLRLNCFFLRLNLIERTDWKLKLFNKKVCWHELQKEPSECWRIVGDLDWMTLKETFTEGVEFFLKKTYLLEITLVNLWRLQKESISLNLLQNSIYLNLILNSNSRILKRPDQIKCLGYLGLFLFASIHNFFQIQDLKKYNKNYVFCVCQSFFVPAIRLLQPLQLNIKPLHSDFKDQAVASWITSKVPKSRGAVNAFNGLGPIFFCPRTLFFY